MTTTSSAISAITPRSCVMSMIAMRFRSRSAFISSRIWAWMVTSSAVVGSSAMRRSGFVESAIAIMTRWRMPPDSWCGYSSARRAASGIPTWVSISIARLRASSPVIPPCVEIDSAIWLPQVKTGLSEVIGSWKIIEIAFPRTSRISSSGRSTRFLPSNRISPPTTRPGRSMSRITESAVTLLPQPDSPTTPSVAPFRMLKLTPSTAFTRPSAVAK